MEIALLSLRYPILVVFKVQHISGIFIKEGYYPNKIFVVKR